MAGMSAVPDDPRGIVPDTKDWTWVLERRCPECGFDPGAQELADLPGLIHDTAMAWSQVLARADVGERPAPGVWAPLEYGCHVRDVHALFGQRVRLMLDEDEPTFASWDQDATALERDYAGQDADRRRGRADRGGGHRGGHLRDRHHRDQGPPWAAVQRRPVHRRVPRQLPPPRRRPPPARRGGGVRQVDETVRAYDRDAAAYAAGTAAMTDEVRRRPRGARGPGRAGCAGAGDRVRRRTRRRPDGVARPAGAAYGHHTRLRRPPARRRATTPTSSTRSSTTSGPRTVPTTPSGPTPPCCTSRGPTCRPSSLGWPRSPAPGGVSGSPSRRATGTGGRPTARSPTPRHFTYWRAEALRDAVLGAGWTDVAIRSGIAGKGSETWLELSAVRG